MMSNCSPSFSQRSASDGEPVSRGTIPHLAVWATRIRRFVALSSTISTVRPDRSASTRGERAGVTASDAATGMRTRRWKVLPSPATPVLSAVSEPSISSARRREIARPRPVPP